MLYLKPFGFGLLGGLIGTFPGVLVWNLGVLEMSGTLLLLSPFMLLGSASGLILGRKVTPAQARSWAAVPGALIGVCGLPLVYPEGSPWYLFVLVPALASGASCYVLALALSRQSLEPSPQRSSPSSEANP